MGVSRSAANERWEKFVVEYLKDPDRSAAEAYLRAGYKRTANNHRARSRAYELLQRPEIQAKIQAHSQRVATKLRENLDFDIEWIVRRLMALADYDPRKFYNEDGSLKPVTQLDDETALALQGFDVEEAFEHFGKGQAKPNGTLKKVKFSDRLRALELLGKYKKMFTEKVEVTGLDTLAEELEKARKRAKE